VLVVIPARNEQATIAGVASSVMKAHGWDVLVVNDASDDDTASRARAAGAGLLDLPISLGAWGAVQAGIRYASMKGYAYVVSMDADGQHDAATLKSLTRPVREDLADVCIGACVSRASRARRLAWSFFRHVASLPFADLTSGLRVYSRKTFDLVIGPGATLLDYQDVGVLALLQRAGMRIMEVNVPMAPRTSGKSRIFSSWGRVLSYLLQTMMLAMAKQPRMTNRTAVKSRRKGQ